MPEEEVRLHIGFSVEKQPKTLKYWNVAKQGGDDGDHDWDGHADSAVCLWSTVYDGDVQVKMQRKK